MSLLPSSFFYNPSTTKPSHRFYTLLRTKTISAQGRYTGRFGRNYGDPHEPQYQQRIRNKPTIIGRTRQQVLEMHPEKDIAGVNDVVHANISSSNNKHSFLHDLYLFTRPYAVIGTILSMPSISTLALSSWTQVSPAFLWEVFKALVPVMLMNVYISGINQYYDVEIDKVNKPYLPLASGVMSMKLGIGIVAASLITSLALGMRYGSPAVMVAVLSLCLLGSLYSIELPFMRWKRSPFLAAAAILVTRALVIPFCTFIHMQKYVFDKPIVFPSALIFTSCFMFLFSIAISLSKDIKDAKGDQMYGVKSASIMFGPKRAFWMCVSILMAAYGGAMVTGASSFFLLNKIVSVFGHFSLASILMHRALRVNYLDNFYMFVWKLWYAEYLLIPFMR